MFTTVDYTQLLVHCLSIGDKPIYDLVKKQGYLQPPPTRGLFSLLVGAIVGQRIRFSKAKNIRGMIYLFKNR